MVARTEAPLLLLALGVFLRSAVAIPSPENVTVRCHNFENVVYWNYSASDQPTYFAVNISRYVSSPHEEKGCTNTSQHHCDISKETREVEEQYFVSVTAMVGSDVSESADSAQFTYYKFFDGQVCLVDFPPVNVSVQEGSVVVSFMHPFDFYRKALKHVKNKEVYKKFVFHVEHENRSHVLSFSCIVRRLCKAVIPNITDVHSFTIEGLMNGMTMTTSTSVNIPVEPRRTHPMMYVIFATCAVIFSIIVVVLCVFVYKYLTRSSSSLPKAVVSVLTNPHRGPSTMNPERENAMLVQAINSPSSDTDLLLYSPDAKSDCTPTDALPKDGSRFPLGARSNGDVSGSSHSSETETSGEEQAVSGVFSSGYDRPKLLDLEMSPGDTVIGYRD
ncbi:interferon gamma receptor 1 isoform X2 [Arapaima gigas]|nr:interferon gamma receptor 1-1 [Arapaima gigas]